MQCRKIDRVESEALPLSTVLQRIGAELETLAGAVDRLQDALAPALVAVAAERPQAMVEFQGLDAVAQTLAGLADFLVALAIPDLDVAVADIADRMPLRDLGDRLLGRTAETTNADFELF